MEYECKWINAMNLGIFNKVQNLRVSVLSVVRFYVIPIAMSFAIFHFLFRQAYILSAFDITLSCYSYFVYQLVQKGKHRTCHVQVFILMILGIVTTCIYLHPVNYGTFIWVMIFPVLLYALLGEKKGYFFSAAFFVTQLTVLSYQILRSDTYVSLVVVLNLNIGYLCIWALAHIYENHHNTIEHSLNNLALRDPLTGANNRLSLTSRFDNFKQDCLCTVPLSFLMIDLDYFKNINDRYGHDVGDRVLIETTKILSQIVGDENVYRLGGEEFCITLFNQNIDQAKAVAEHIRETVSEHLFIVDQNQIQITLSTGICEYNHGDQLVDLLKFADIPLYQAKENGRNQVCLYYQQK